MYTSLISHLVDQRREQLIAWKLERDRKRQFETKKKSFVVKHVSYSPTKYLVSSANKKAARKQAFLENQTCTRRITRSYAKNCAISEETKRGNKVSGFSFCYTKVVPPLS